MNSTNNWLNALPQDKQEKVFGAMRHIGEVCYPAESNSLPGDVLAVGGGGFDKALPCEVLSFFLRCLREGNSPVDAAEASKDYSRQLIQSHNAQRPNDLNWGRWQGAGDAKVDWALRIVLNASN